MSCAAGNYGLGQFKNFVLPLRKLGAYAGDVALFVPCAAASVAYAVTKKWWLNNLLGCAFSVQGIEMLALGSYAIGCILLCGLFVYDVFWVFGTEVMVAVAKNLNAPVKILFPKAVNVTPIPVSMLGLGEDAKQDGDEELE